MELISIYVEIPTCMYRKIRMGIFKSICICFSVYWFYIYLYTLSLCISYATIPDFSAAPVDIHMQIVRCYRYRVVKIHRIP